MLLIPAIDIKDGQCVRLRQGDMHDVTVFGDNPVAVAQRWIDEGADRIHVVDLDGAKAGYPVNDRVIGEIVDAAGRIPVQVGGGIRDEAAIETYLERGVEFVILGTRAVSEPHFVADVGVEFPGHIIVGLDARDGMVATDGWSKLSNHTVADLAQQFEEDGVVAIIHTDISRDGMMQGLNVEATRALAAELTIPVIASGGVTDMADIDALLEVESDGVAGAVIGRAIYEGTLDLAAARKRVNERKGG
ncbi:1-(5-phosphoribosyl)-5-[(5-phosphoribosylamino)methylideneamino]imidazole-4-carboxamide isomerase [Salinisphaera hydrothermalis]|uniref:1-(5-phosphoribosyl)-5-[(5-phosphoribosylamino)methylideneamino] imidazole-4-carboxamide isomerase n=1 Tax=Salinisphaera hydrothermalis (strain C41B8) TaxID=1304275 RepID=A0A084IRJ4_SALHC|nr:1-(5-phosphoribosyl)-5-[(5-phosphoribosylamino)methylideneamino]imidazole-4-carboxamide isomerase [Salinisphaera hydrothermalis]KEZ79328.1 Phosphoribosylformimino-5-aminoimidazole carboxamide ribotide isomerase [Salinisphaera hydrothermalis C41B8]